MQLDTHSARGEASGNEMDLSQYAQVLLQTCISDATTKEYLPPTLHHEVHVASPLLALAGVAKLGLNHSQSTSCCSTASA